MEPETITCPECSGVAHRIGFVPPDAATEPGDVIAYVCEDCGHRLDLVVQEDEGVV